MITVAGLTKIYRPGADQVIAFADLSFTLPAGELVGLMGPSGSGKSTLFNILGGLDRATAGTVTVGETTLSKLSDDQLTLYRRHTVGFVFQAANLIPALTVYENVMLPLVPAPLPHSAKEQRVQAALDQANIAHRARHLPGELSGGEQQRAAVARTIVNEPSLILADEPTGELDADNAARVLELLVALNAAGRTVLIASHDQNVIGATRRVLHLRDGKLQD